MSDEIKKTLKERIAELTGETPAADKPKRAPSPHSAAHAIQNSSFVNSGTTEANTDAHYRVTDKPRARATEIRLSNDFALVTHENIDSAHARNKPTQKSTVTERETWIDSSARNTDRTFVADTDSIAKISAGPNYSAESLSGRTPINYNSNIIDQYAGSLEARIAENAAAENAGKEAKKVNDGTFTPDPAKIAAMSGAADATVNDYLSKPFIQYRSAEDQKAFAEQIYSSDIKTRLPFRGMKEDPTPAKPLLSPEDEARLITGSNEIEEVDLSATPVPD